jgi:predicted acetyltransferase
MLWASQGSIYGRFGYGLASLSYELDLPKPWARLRAPRPGHEVEGRFRLIDESTSLDTMPPLYEQVRRTSPGMLSRSREWWRIRRSGDADWQRRGRQPLQRVLLEIDGVLEGYALYRHAPGWDHGAPTGVLEVTEAIGTTPRATRAVWSYLASVDLIERIKCAFLPADHPLLWLFEHSEQLHLRASHGLWVRLVDVEAALSARRYLEAGPLVIEVEDEACPWNTGRYRIADGRAVRTTDTPSLRLDAAALGSVYLGGVSAAALAQAGRVDELVPGALLRADAVLRGARAPWCPEIF